MPEENVGELESAGARERKDAKIHKYIYRYGISFYMQHKSVMRIMRV